MPFETLRIIRAEHAGLSAILRAMLQQLRQGPDEDPPQFFDRLRAMLFYIDEFPERQHHPKESNLLFPRVVRVAPQAMDTIALLERDHMQGESRARELQHLLLAWELLGESRRAPFVEAAERYVAFYVKHMRLEETAILPLAEQWLNEDDRRELDEAFGSHADPLLTRDPAYERLFSRLALEAATPVGVGAVSAGTQRGER